MLSMLAKRSRPQRDVVRLERLAAFGRGGQITQATAQRLIDNIRQARFARLTYPLDHGGYIVVQRQRSPHTSSHKTFVALMSTQGMP